jgi:hypothetical protein
VVTGTLSVSTDIALTNQDCAEDFDLVEEGMVEPGTVMVLGDAGRLRRSHRPYDRGVVGVVSGAGDYKPGLILGRQPGPSGLRIPVALVGKVFCKVDAAYGAIEIGDLLTTSPTTGHAMKAEDPSRAFGAVLGKSLGVVPAGRGVVPILVALQEPGAPLFRRCR